jgi:hypothetical protein
MTTYSNSDSHRTAEGFIPYGPSFDDQSAAGVRHGDSNENGYAQAIDPVE